MHRKAIAITCIIIYLLLVQGCGNAEGTPSLSVQTVADTTTESEDNTVNSTGVYGTLSVTIPKSWDCTICPEGSDKLMYGLYGIILKPKNASDGWIELFCSTSFGVCGTGLTQNEMVLAGYNAYVGTYYPNKNWDFIVFTNKKPQIVAQHTDCSSWTDDMWKSAMEVLDTVKLK